MTTETKWTPGPWKLKGAGSIMGADDVLVATTGYRVAVGSDEDESSARLIAAAPELYEALDAITHWNDRDGHVDASWWNAARAALARARGAK